MRPSLAPPSRGAHDFFCCYSCTLPRTRYGGEECSVPFGTVSAAPLIWPATHPSIDRYTRELLRRWAWDPTALICTYRHQYPSAGLRFISCTLDDGDVT